MPYELATKSIIALGAFFAAALVASGAFAQDLSAPATYGRTSLSAGFTPDPTVVSIVTGGNSVQVTQPGCTGWILNAPDYELTYEAGSWPLNIYFKGDGDTTILINGPDGSWHCNDDANGFNPHVSFPTPMSGVYDIWVGTYSQGGGAVGTLNISELAPQW